MNILTIDNYKDFVGYQEQQEGDRVSTEGKPFGNLLYVDGTNNSGQFSISYNKIPVDCILEEWEIVNEINRMIQSFPETIVEWYNGDQKYHYQIGIGNKILWKSKSPMVILPNHPHRRWYKPWFSKFDIKEHWNDCQLQKLKNEVARNTRRGVANTQVENVIYYQGQTNIKIDAPIIVVKGLNGKFAVVQHPHFERYGFHITNWNEQ